MENNWSTLNSEVPSVPLFVGVNSRHSIHWEGARVSSWSEAEVILRANATSVVFVDIGKIPVPDMLAFFDKRQGNNRNFSLVVYKSKISLSEIAEISSRHPISYIIDTDNEATWTQAFAKALTEFQEEQQNRTLHEVILQQNNQLKETSKNLKDRILRREKGLGNSERRLLHLNRRSELLKKAMMSVHKAQSVGEIESLLTEALEPEFKTEWIRILHQSQSLIFEQSQKLGLKLLSLPLLIGPSWKGNLVVARATDFTKEEGDFLTRILELVRLAIDRLAKFDSLENLKQQWELTFDSIAEPLCMTNEDFEIQRTNKAFLELTGRSFKQIIGKLCFSFFENVQVDSSTLEKNPAVFRIEDNKKGEKKKIFEVTVHNLMGPEFYRLVLFRNITQQLQLEKKVLETAKLAELGMVGGSIAHELNNPLGGIISFLQLIKMELPKEDPKYEDITAMEEAAQKSKEIIQNLLDFSRGLG